MTNPTPSDHDKKRDASTVTGQPQRGSPVGAPAPTSKDADLSRSGSKTTEILQAATAGRPASGHAASSPSQGARVDAKSPNDQGRRDPSSRSDDASSGGHSDRAQAKDGSREDGARRPSGRDEGLTNAVRSLIACCDQLVREIPRGAAARFDGVNAELSKARSALDQGSTSQGAPSKSLSTSPSKSPSSNAPSSAPGTVRTARLEDDESSDSPSAPASM